MADWWRDEETIGELISRTRLTLGEIAVCSLMRYGKRFRHEWPGLGGGQAA